MKQFAKPASVLLGYAVTVSGDVRISGVTITATEKNTLLTVSGANTSLTSNGNIVMNHEGLPVQPNVLVVDNNAKLDVKNP